MEVQAVTKYVRMSPSKARDLTRAIQGRTVAEAVGLTATNRRKAAFQVAKTLKSAIANAENNEGVSVDDLFVKQAVIEEGPTMKRFWPRARGMVSPIKRKTCHVRIVLTDVKQKKHK